MYQRPYRTTPLPQQRTAYAPPIMQTGPTPQPQPLTAFERIIGLMSKGITLGAFIGLLCLGSAVGLAVQGWQQLFPSQPPQPTQSAVVAPAVTRIVVIVTATPQPTATTPAGSWPPYNPPQPLPALPPAVPPVAVVQSLDGDEAGDDWVWADLFKDHWFACADGTRWKAGDGRAWVQDWHYTDNAGKPRKHVVVVDLIDSSKHVGCREE
jgi:hypothetical protein